MNQRRLTAQMPLDKVTFRMQSETAAYIRAAARMSGLSQSAVLNAIILDFALRQVEPEELKRSFTLRKAADYASMLCGHLPKNTISHLLAFCQDITKDKI